MTLIPALRRILLVEDEPEIQVVVGLALEKLGGFEVETCGSGHEAIERAPVFSPDLILLDVMMPGMDGPATFEALHRLGQLAAVPVIFLTASVQPHELARLRALGALDVIAKPFDPMSLADTVLQAWRRHHGW